MPEPTRRPTRDEAIADAGRVVARMRIAMDSMTPSELAEAAWHPSCGKTRAELEDQIRADRGLQPRERGGDTSTT